jgi:tetratricopeptide (TPR) repeat protein
MDLEFLKRIAIEYQLSPEQTEMFVLRFDPAHSQKNQVQLAAQLNIGPSALQKRMTDVYGKLEAFCPALKSQKRGKVETLRAALQVQWQEKETISHKPEVNQKSASEAAPKASTPESPLLKNLQTISGDGQGSQVNNAQGPVIVGSNPVVNIKLPERREKTLKKTILILPASPESIASSQWRKELVEIRSAVHRGDKGKSFDIQDRPYVSSSDLSEELTNLSPYIIHISGCTDGIERLFLGDSNQSIHRRSQNELIAETFRLHAQKVRCLVLSGCHLEEQIREIVQHVQFVIGITKDLEEPHTIQFINEFYNQIAFGREIIDSYDSGCNLLRREGFYKEPALPKIFIREKEIRRTELEKELSSRIEETNKNPSDVQSWEQIAVLLTGLGRLEEAQKIFDTAAELAPKKHTVRVVQGDTLWQQGESQKAIDAYSQALDLGLGKKDYKVWWKKAQVHAATKMYIEATECYKKALTLLPPSPDDYVICREYGAILDKLGRFYEGILLYNTSLSLQPNYRVASHYKKQAYKKIYSKKI